MKQGYKAQDTTKEKKYNEMIKTAFHLYGNTKTFTNFCATHPYRNTTIERAEFTIKDLNAQLEELDGSL